MTPGLTAKSLLYCLPFLAVLGFGLFLTGLNGFGAWAALPMVVSMLLWPLGHGGTPVRWASRVAAVAMTGFSAFWFLAWQFDWRETQTGHSTSGLLFVFLPVWSLIVGAVVWVLTWLGKKVMTSP